jgi:hypothetical protein
MINAATVFFLASTFSLLLFPSTSLFQTLSRYLFTMSYRYDNEKPPDGLAYGVDPYREAFTLEDPPYNGTESDLSQDLRDMQRLGKQQLFKRNFSFISTLGFISIYMATWEFVLVSLALGLINGGFGGLFWTFIGTVICYSSIVARCAATFSCSVEREAKLSRL